LPRDTFDGVDDDAWCKGTGSLLGEAAIAIVWRITFRFPSDTFDGEDDEA
jgi:hypothetical protein